MKILIKIIIPGLIAILLAGCKKDHSVLGVDVQPDVDDLNAEYLGDLLITAHTLKYDSITSFNNRYRFLGSNDDDAFGTTDAGIYLNANMSVTNQSFGPTAILTSAEIVLALDAATYIGDLNAVLNYSVFPLDSILSTSRVYFTSNEYLHNPIPIISGTVAYTKTSSNIPILKIPIDSTYAQRLLLDTANLINNEVFQRNYKGFYIKTSLPSGEGIIYKADLEDGLSGFFLHYRKSLAPADTVKDFKFIFSGINAVRINTLKFKPTTTLKNQISGDTAAGSTNLFLGGMGITKLKFRIPFLKYNPDSVPKAINRAEIIFNVDRSLRLGNGNYTPPDKLVILPLDSLGRETYAKDLLNASDYAMYRGVYDQDNSRYVFNIARHVQAILSGKVKNYGFYLTVANADVTLSQTYYENSKELYLLRRDNFIERVVFAGSNNPALKPKFNLTYIKFSKE